LCAEDRRAVIKHKGAIEFLLVRLSLKKRPSLVAEQIPKDFLAQKISTLRLGLAKQSFDDWLSKTAFHTAPAVLFLFWF